MKTFLFVQLVLWQALGAATAQPAEPAAERLLAAYRTAPQDYPEGADLRGLPYARPDTGAWFRWHCYHDGAIDRCESTPMDVHVEPYNLLEGVGAQVPYRSPVKFSFVAEHATEGAQCLKVDFPAAEVASGKGTVLVRALPGKSFYPPGSKYHFKHAAAAYWCHYRFLKFDAFNPGQDDVRIRVCGVPFVLRPGPSVVAVKTPDASGQEGPHSALHDRVDVTVTAPAADVTLYLDNFRMEQEAPRVLRRKGRWLQFAARADPQGEPVLWPGFKAVGPDDLYQPSRGWGWTAAPTKRRCRAHTFRSFENGLLWGYLVDADCPLRIDAPEGRCGVWILATPMRGFSWEKGAEVEINGKRHALIRSRSQAQVRRMALGGESWDFRPGACVWEQLVRQPYYPPTELIFVDAGQGRLDITLPEAVALRAVGVFAEADKDQALAELGRLNFLMAESWDTTHGWVKGDAAERLRYLGFHEESSRPECIPARLDALRITAEEWRRGFLLFQRGLTEAVYPDTIPNPDEARPERLATFAAPGESECLTLGLLPLAEVRGLKLAAGELKSEGGAAIPAEAIDVRVSRCHQKCMDYGHHNHNYNYQEHDLVVRPALDLFPGAARRAYFDVRVPDDARPGRYAGRVTIEGSGPGQRVELALELEVLPIRLQSPAVSFATESSSPLLKQYGINAVAGDYDRAAEDGFAAALVCPYDASPARLRGKRLGWSSFLANKGLVQALIDDGRSGRAPRAFFGGYMPKIEGFADRLLQELPGVELIGHNVPTYVFAGPGYTWGWDGFNRSVRTRGKLELLQAAAAAGPNFWFVDWVKNSKEQAARFTFGFWLWKLGPMGRFSTFIHNLSYFGATAKDSYPWLPYYALLDIGGSNRYGAFSESLDEGRLNPCRDLVLVREGIDDYRYAHTLDRLIERAEKAMRARPALDRATAFRRELAEALSLDLGEYYESRGGAEYVAYAENWFPRAGNPWTSARFDAVRRACAEHILALQKALE